MKIAQHLTVSENFMENNIKKLLNIKPKCEIDNRKQNPNQKTKQKANPNPKTKTKSKM
jgi:hypothetical protein